MEKSKKVKVEKKSKIMVFLKKFLYPLIKVGKPYLREWAMNKLVPVLQKKVNAGAKNIDKAVDNLIAISVEEAIKKL